MTARWLDAVLWRCRWYRRRVMRRSGVWDVLMQKPLTLGDVESARYLRPPAMPKDFGQATLQRMRDFGTITRTLDEITRDVECELETPAILTRGPRSFLEPLTENLSRRAGSWPILSVCLACSEGDHSRPLPYMGSCSCPCHGGTPGTA